jgi:hypothetical protein
MQNIFLDLAVKVAASVCGMDGVISEAEENKIYELVINESKTFSKERFNKALDEFFDSNDQIEDYLKNINSVNHKEFTIKLCELSASADGLDIKENIALHKVKLILGGDL